MRARAPSLPALQVSAVKPGSTSRAETPARGHWGISCWGAQLSPQAWSLLPMPRAVLTRAWGWHAPQLSPTRMSGTGRGARGAGDTSEGCLRDWPPLPRREVGRAGGLSRLWCWLNPTGDEFW